MQLRDASNFVSRRPHKSDVTVLAMDDEAVVYSCVTNANGRALLIRGGSPCIARRAVSVYARCVTYCAH